MHQLRVYYFLEWQNYLQLFVFVGAIVFVSAQFAASTNRCWCASEGIWQLGAAVVTCSWCNFILVLKDYPFYNIGGHITLLLNICKRYLKLVYLPILLMASFGFSFYMLYVAKEVILYTNINFTFIISPPPPPRPHTTALYRVIAHKPFPPRGGLWPVLTLARRGLIQYLLALQ